MEGAAPRAAARSFARDSRSQIEAVLPDFAHERCALLQGGGGVGLGIEEGAGFVDQLHTETCQSIKLRPTIRQRFQEYGNVVVEIGARIASRARAKQHYTVEPISIYVIQRLPEAGEDGVVVQCSAQLESPRCLQTR
jgi:hypothetical protein